MKAALYDQSGKKKGDITLNKDIFGIEVNGDLIHQYLIYQESNARNAVAHTKSRGEVSGGGKKPFRQKGTGRARQGSTRNVHQRGGNVTFGPRNTRNFTLMMPKKQRRKALFCTLSSKAKEGQVMVLDTYTAKEAKTKPFNEMIQKLPIERDVLVVIAEKDEVIQKSSRNIANAKTILVNYLNPKDLMKYHHVLFLENALEKIETTFLKK